MPKKKIFFSLCLIVNIFFSNVDIYLNFGNNFFASSGKKLEHLVKDEKKLKEIGRLKVEWSGELRNQVLDCVLLKNGNILFCKFI